MDMLFAMIRRHKANRRSANIKQPSAGETGSVPALAKD
jgi:hypothetical protein